MCRLQYAFVDSGHAVGSPALKRPLAAGSSPWTRGAIAAHARPRGGGGDRIAPPFHSVVRDAAAAAAAAAWLLKLRTIHFGRRRAEREQNQQKVGPRARGDRRGYNHDRRSKTTFVAAHPRPCRARGTSDRSSVLRRAAALSTQLSRRTSNERSYAETAQAVFVMLKRPSARRGPGLVSVDRNVRSKCRCSCVLQFTSRRAISCVLHRPTSRVIHRSG